MALSERGRFSVMSIQRLIIALSLIAVLALVVNKLGIPLIGLVVVIVALFVIGGISLSGLGWRSGNLKRDFLAGVLGFFAAAAVLIASLLVFQEDFTLRGFLAHIASYPLDRRISLVALGLVAAFMEESTFRGYLQPALVERWGLAPGVIATASIYALYHLRLDPFLLMNLFLLGLILGFLRGQDRSLFAPATAHALLWMVLGDG